MFSIFSPVTVVVVLLLFYCFVLFSVLFCFLYFYVLCLGFEGGGGLLLFWGGYVDWHDVLKCVVLVKNSFLLNP